jgi:hypothetical protein
MHGHARWVVGFLLSSSALTTVSSTGQEAVSHPTSTSAAVRQDKAGSTTSIQPRTLQAGWVAFSPDGKSYAAAIAGKKPLTLYATNTGVKIEEFDGEKNNTISGASAASQLT